MREVDFVYLNNDALRSIRECYLKEIAYWKKDGREGPYVSWLECEVSQINLELVNRGEKE